MKKIMGLILIGCLVLFFSFTAQGGEKYKIEKLTPEIISVIGLQYDSKVNRDGFGTAFAEAIKEIGKEYEIEDITAINYYVGWGSHTKELLIKVKPRKK